MLNDSATISNCKEIRCESVTFRFFSPLRDSKPVTSVYGNLMIELKPE